MNERRWLLLLGVLALLLRLGAIQFATTGGVLGPGDDDGDHVRFARSLLQEGAIVVRGADQPYPAVLRAWRPPLFILFLTGVFKLHGIDSFLAARLYIAFLSLLVPLAVWRMARVLWSPAAGVVGFAWATIHPPFVYYATHVQSDSIFLIVVAWAVALMTVQTTAVQTFFSGLVSGIAMLGRSQFAGGAIAGFLWSLMKPRPASRRIWAGLLVLGVLLAVSPWWIRNYRIFHQFVPFSTEGGYTLWVGNNPVADGGGDCPVSPAPAGLSERDFDRWHYKEAVRYIKDRPGRTARLALSKLARFWGVIPRVGGLVVKVVSFATYASLFSLSILGLWFRRRDLRPFIPFFLLCAYYTAVQTIFPSLMRYRLALEPGMIAIAAGALLEVVARRRAGVVPDQDLLDGAN